MYEHFESLVPNHSFERDFVSPQNSPRNLSIVTSDRSSVQISSAAVNPCQIYIYFWPTSSSLISLHPVHPVSAPPSITAKSPLSPSKLAPRYLRPLMLSLTIQTSTPRLQLRSKNHAIIRGLGLQRLAHLITSQCLMKIITAPLPTTQQS